MPSDPALQRYFGLPEGPGWLINRWIENTSKAALKTETAINRIDRAGPPESSFANGISEPPRPQNANKATGSQSAFGPLIFTRDQKKRAAQSSTTTKSPSIR